MGYGDNLISKGYALRAEKHRTYFNPDFKVTPGHLPINPGLVRWAVSQAVAKCVMVNPHVKKWPGKSKDWGWEKWLELAEKSGYKLFQCGYGKPSIPGVPEIETPTFEHAAALLKVCRGIVTTEGGMHHAAGALLKPAVIIFGGTNPPSVLGYDFHENLAVDYPEALGRRGPHPACQAAMDMITVDAVLEAMGRAFG